MSHNATNKNVLEHPWRLLRKKTTTQAAMLASPPDVWKGHLQGWPEPYIHIFMVFLAGYLAGYLARYFWQGYSILFVYDHFGNSLIIWPENEYFY